MGNVKAVRVRFFMPYSENAQGPQSSLSRDIDRLVQRVRDFEQNKDLTESAHRAVCNERDGLKEKVSKLEKDLRDMTNSFDNVCLDNKGLRALLKGERPHLSPNDKGFNYIARYRSRPPYSRAETHTEKEIIFAHNWEDAVSFALRPTLNGYKQLESLIKNGRE